MHYCNLLKDSFCRDGNSLYQQYLNLLSCSLMLNLKFRKSNSTRSFRSTYRYLNGCKPYPNFPWSRVQMAQRSVCLFSLDNCDQMCKYMKLLTNSLALMDIVNSKLWSLVSKRNQTLLQVEESISKEFRH